MLKLFHCQKRVARFKKKRGNPFSHPEAPKSSQNSVIWSVFGSYQEQNNAIYDVFLPWEPQNRVKTLVFTMFLQQRKRCFWRMPEKNKINIRMAKIQKRCILPCFSLSGAKTSVSKSAHNIVIYNVFCSHQRQNNAIYDVFLLSQPQNRTETSVFTMFLQHQKKPA